MKLLDITENKPSSSYEQTSDDLIKCPLLTSPVKIHMHHSSPNICLPWTLKVNYPSNKKMVRCHSYIINEVLVMFFHDHPYLFHCVIKRLSSLHWEHHIMFHAWFSLIDICCNTSYRSYISRFFQSYQLRPIVNHTQLT